MFEVCRIIRLMGAALIVRSWNFGRPARQPCETHQNRQPEEKLYVSIVTLAGMRFGIERVADPTKRADLHAWLTHKVRPMFEQRILSVSEDVMFKWRLLVEEGRKTGHTFSQPDLIIAATALHHGLTVVTRDTADYAKARVELVNPWE